MRAKNGTVTPRMVCTGEVSLRFLPHGQKFPTMQRKTFRYPQAAPFARILVMKDESSRNGLLRVTLYEHDMQSLMGQFPKLTRTEISDIVARHGPMRTPGGAWPGRLWCRNPGRE